MGPLSTFHRSELRIQYQQKQYYRLNRTIGAQSTSGKAVIDHESSPHILASF